MLLGGHFYIAANTAIQTALRVQSVGRPGAPASVDRRKGQPSHDRAQLARHPAHRRHHCCRDRRAKPDSAETRLLSAAERARDSPAGSRSRRAHPVHDRLDSGCRTPTACPDRAQQRRSSSCAEAGNQLPPPR